MKEAMMSSKNRANFTRLSRALIEPGLPAVRTRLHLGAMRLHAAVGGLLEPRDELAAQSARDVRDGRGVVAVLPS